MSGFRIEINADEGLEADIQSVVSDFEEDNPNSVLQASVSRAALDAFAVDVEIPSNVDAENLASKLSDMLVGVNAVDIRATTYDKQYNINVVKWDRCLDI